MSKAKNGQSKGFHSKKQDNEINSPDTTDIATNDSKDIFTSSQHDKATCHSERSEESSIHHLRGVKR